MATSSFKKSFVLSNSDSIATLIELNKEPAKIKTRERNNKEETEQAIKLLSKVLVAKHDHC